MTQTEVAERDAVRRQAIECHQLPSTRGMPGNDLITIKGEAQTMKAASAEMADGTEKHDIGLDAR